MSVRTILAMVLMCSMIFAETRIAAEPIRSGARGPQIQRQASLPQHIRHKQKSRVQRRSQIQGLVVVSDITRAQAVRAAIRCNKGGEALKPPVRKGRGFVVKILKGSYVKLIKVDKDGNCG